MQKKDKEADAKRLAADVARLRTELKVMQQACAPGKPPALLRGRQLTTAVGNASPGRFDRPASAGFLLSEEADEARGTPLGALSGNTAKWARGGLRASPTVGSRGGHLPPSGRWEIASLALRSGSSSLSHTHTRTLTQWVVDAGKAASKENKRCRFVERPRRLG